MTFNAQMSVITDRHSVIGAVHRGDCKRLRFLLRDPAKHDKADMARGLALAADKGHEECTRILLSEGALPNIHDNSGFTPLILAAKRGHVEIIKQLLAAKCLINKVTFHIRATALHWAATNGHEECVRLLLNSGADPQMATIHGRTPLMLAARSDEEEIVKLLLDKNVDIKAKDFEGATALHLAAEEGADTCARALLKAGADINAQMNNGDTPVMGAARRCQPVVLRMLLHRATLDLQKRGHHLTALHWAAVGGNRECAELLMCAQISPNVKTLDSYHGGNLVVNCGVTPVMLAAERGHCEVLETLLEHGGKVDDSDDEGKTALLYAIRKQHLDCVRILLKAGADPDGIPINVSESEPEERGLSPIFYAIKQDNVPTVKLLLQANCNLRVLGYLKQDVYVTPLEFAISKQRFRVARMLLAAGCGTDIASQGLVEEGLAQLLQQNEQEFVQFAQLFHTPCTLLQMARNSIRNHIGRKIKTVISILPLPLVLQNYVDLNDLDDLG